MMESIVAKNTSIKDFKKQIVEEAKKQGVECELRSDRWLSHDYIVWFAYLLMM